MDVVRYSIVLCFTISFLYILCNSQLAEANWYIETVDSGDDTGRCTSLALDSNNNPHISYWKRDDLSFELKHTYYNGTSWQSETVYSSSRIDAGLNTTSIDIDSNDLPHIAFHYLLDDYYPYALRLEKSFMIPEADYYTRYAYYDGSSWHYPYYTYSGGQCSLVLDSNDNPHISYARRSIQLGGPALIYTYYDGSVWQEEEVFSDWEHLIRYPSIALDSNNRPHVVFAKGLWAIFLNPELIYTYFDGISWHNETFDNEVVAGGISSLALDSSDNPHISYYDSDNGDLKYAYYDGNWHVETIDSEGAVGWNNSLVLDSSDNPHISYYDSDNGDLKYACYDGNWHVETIDSEGAVGGTNSLALDSSDNPHISYYDYTNSALKYARFCPDDSDCDGILDDDDECTDTDRDGYGNPGFPNNTCPLDNCPESANPDQADTDSDLIGDVCDNCPEVSNPEQTDTDEDSMGDVCDNCPNDYNPNQEDTYPPQGNGIGDACDCESDFDCSGSVDSLDVEHFLWDFGRSQYNDPCTNDRWCYGDFLCDGSVDAADVTKFLEDFGRSEFFNPCPACEVGEWCVYP